MQYFREKLEWESAAVALFFPDTSILTPIDMFGKMFELGSLMKQAQQFGGKVQEMNDKLKLLRISGSAAGGLVTVEMNGLQEMIGCKIDPSLFKQEDAELLEELVVAATNQAVEESRRRQAETMQSLTEGVDLGSLGEALGKIMPPS